MVASGVCTSSSLWVFRTGSASDWCALQEALYICIDNRYNTIHRRWNDRCDQIYWHRPAVKVHGAIDQLISNCCFMIASSFRMTMRRHIMSSCQTGYQQEVPEEHHGCPSNSRI